MSTLNIYGQYLMVFIPQVEKSSLKNLETFYYLFFFLNLDLILFEMKIRKGFFVLVVQGKVKC